jgi:diguanylate cyclase (GGDEF)-like protein
MQEAGGPIRWLRYWGQVLLLAGIYFAAAKASLLLAIPPGYATAVWPPSGIALAAILALGNRMWPGVWLGAALVNLTVASSPFAAFFVGTGNTLEALAGAALVRRHIAVAAPYFDRARNVVKFVALAAVCSTVAATIGVGSLALEGTVPGPEFVANWGTWWHGDTAGIIIVTPLVLTWSLRHPFVWTPAKRWEAAGFVMSLTVAALAVFGQGDQYLSSLPLTFMILPFIIWAAFRFSRREVTTAAAAVCAIAVWQTVEGQGPFALETLNLSLSVLLAFISTVVTTGLILSAAVAERSRSMDRLAEAMRELQAQARTDPLTGLANRRHLWEFLQREWIRARRRSSPLAIVMIDLDHFKRVNDTFGHDAGDCVLLDVSELLKAHIRGSDIACRFGGEEFALVLPDATLDAVRRRAEGIREAIGRLEPSHRGRRLGRVTASLGVAVFPDHADDPESLLRAADQALYEAKTAGRNRVLISSASRARPQPSRAAAFKHEV